MTFTLLAVSAIVPSLLIMRYFHSRDRTPAPRRVLWATFGLGVLSVFGILFVGTYEPIVSSIRNPYIRGVADAFFLAAIPEEALKLLVLVRFCARKKEYNEPLDGLVYGAAVSLGFATFENVLYVAEHGLGTAILRAFTAVPGHAFSGAILGWHVSQWKFFGNKRAVAIGYGWVVLLHGLYDAPLLMMQALGESKVPKDGLGWTIVGLLVVLVTLPALIVEIVWARRLLLRARDEQDGPNTKARNREEKRRRVLESWVMVDYVYLVGGGLLTSMGALFLFGFTVGALFDRSITPSTLVGVAMIGTPILVVGLVLYDRGLRRRTARIDAQRTPSAWTRTRIG
jgi:protease PrsW